MSNAEPLLKIDLFADHADVTVSGGTKKTIDPLDLRTLLQEAIYKEGEGNSSASNLPSRPIILPEGTVAFEQTATRRFVRMFFASRIVDVSFSNRYCTGKYKIPLPGMIIEVPLSLQDGKWIVSTNQVRYIATCLTAAQISQYATISFEDGKFWEPPIPNFFGNGRACFGSASPVSGFSDNLSGLYWYYTFLYSATFNSDLSPHSIRGRYYDQFNGDRGTACRGVLAFLNGKTEFPYYILNGSTEKDPN